MASRKKMLDLSLITRKRNFEMENFLNKQIQKDKSDKWRCATGNNYGLAFQQSIGDFFEAQKDKMGVVSVEVNLNPSDPRPDVVLTMQDGTIDNREVKSFKDEMLPGLTICNHPSLLKDTLTYVVNYVMAGDKIAVRTTIETQLHRLTGIAKGGKYKGCLLSTRDNGKKLKGRCFRDFYFGNPNDDIALEILIAPEMILKTELHYTVAKLVPGGYETEEVADAYDYQKNYTR